MENREERDEGSLEVPTQKEIIDFILGWRQKPEVPPLKPNQITTKELGKLTGRSYSWCKETLKDMHRSGVCVREKFVLRSGFINVFTFPDTLPKFSSSTHKDKVE